MLSPALVSVCGRVNARAARPQRLAVTAAVSVEKKTFTIGTRGSPLALAQAYLTRDLLKVRPASDVWMMCPSPPLFASILGNHRSSAHEEQSLLPARPRALLEPIPVRRLQCRLSLLLRL